MAFIAMFAFSIAADAQEWAYQGDYSEGLACVKDKNGNVAIPFNYTNAYSFQNGKAKVQDENREWRKIDKTGQFIE